MRRFLGFILAGCMVAVAAGASYAASVSKSTITASVGFTGAGAVNMSFQLKSLTSPSSTPTTIAWVGATPASTWKVADTYLVLSSTITDTKGAIQIYTDNLNAQANPRYSNTVNLSTGCAGLICQEDTTRSLDMCWRINGSSLSVADATIWMNPATYQLTPSASQPLFPAYLYMSDKGKYNWSSVVSSDYCTIKDFAHGIHFAEGPADYSSGWGLTVDPVDYVYFGANFANAATASTGIHYTTNMLILEALIE